MIPSQKQAAKLIGGDGGENSWEMLTKRGHGGTFRAAGDVLCLDLGGDYAGIHTC